MSERSIRRAHQRRLAAERRRETLKRRRTGLATGAAIGATVLFAPSAQAAPFEVNTLNDAAADACDTGVDGCTLRDAVDAANNNAEADTITFADALTGEITLTEGEIDITEPDGLAIVDAGLNEVTVSGDANDDDLRNAGDSRIFDIDTEAPVSITGLTVTEGFINGAGKYGGAGGAILARDGSEVAITGSQVTDSYADGSGGGILNAGAMTITDSEITGNGSFIGGGVSSSGDKYEDNGQVRAIGDPRSLTVTDSTISDNDAYSGGGIFSSGAGGDGSQAFGTLTVTESEVSGNQAETGGGAQAKYTNTTISGSTIEDNEGDIGAGGINSFDGPLEIRDSEILGNDAGGGAGGVAFSSNPDASPATASVIARTTISGNSTESAGGGVRVGNIGDDESLLISATTISGNDGLDTEGNEDSRGGGIAIPGNIAGDFRLSNSTVSGNTAAFGGGISFDLPNNESMARAIGEGGSLVLSNSTIAANAATQEGGGLFLGRYYSSDAEDYLSSVIPLSSTIVADNTAAGAPNDLGQTAEATSGGFRLTNSLVETPGAPTVTQDPAGASILGSDPALGALAGNGGPTQTHLPADASLAIDKGLANGLTTDQRGGPRTADRPVANGAGDGTDMGSVEIAALAPPAGPTPGANPLCQGEEATIVAKVGQPTTGTPGPDVIVGTSSPDVIDAVAGDDLVCARAGEDDVEGGTGNDRIFGEGDSDELSGEAGRDRISGFDGADDISGGDGADRVGGGRGNDSLAGGDGNDRAKGASGNDTIAGEGGADRMSGNSGNDQVAGGSGNDRLHGRTGNDRLSGGSGGDFATGDRGEDRVRGGTGDDRLFGAENDDTIRGGDGDDRLVGATGDDTLRGDEGDDRLFGGPGEDSLDGGPGNDDPEEPVEG